MQGKDGDRLCLEAVVRNLCQEAVYIYISVRSQFKKKKSGVNILINMDQFYLSETIRFFFFLIQIKESFECDSSFSTEVEL